MREEIGMTICAAILLYTLGALAWSLTAKPCEMCGKLTMLHARLRIGQRPRRVRVCRLDRQILKRKNLLRPGGRPRRPVSSTPPTTRKS